MVISPMNNPRAGNVDTDTPSWLLLVAEGSAGPC